MISWIFAVAAVLLAVLPSLLPRPARAVAIALLSAGAVWLIWAPPLIPILAASAAVYGLGLWLPRLREPARGAVLAAGVVAVVGTLAWLRAAQPDRATLVATTAVVGLSYFSLKFIQHLVDSAAGRAREVGPVDFVANVFFLPTFSAGPIERTDEFARALDAEPPSWSERILGVERILFGLGKKLVIGDFLLGYAEPSFRNPELLSTGALWLAAYAFAIALYLDFAGYSDVAIGVARLAGIRVRENFDFPYLQRNLTLLWQHWHMSLTSWLRDFLFIPIARRMLRRTRRPMLSQATAQTVTMVACGLWHGLAWNFAAWGLYHAIALTLLAVWRQRRGPARRSPVRDAASTLLTFHVFVVGTVIFGCDLPRAGVFLGRLFGIGSGVAP